VEWYLTNAAWVEGVTSGAYQQWMTQNYGGREASATADERRKTVAAMESAR
jgi:dTDP-glucose 4,6-dehydratase